MIEEGKWYREGRKIKMKYCGEIERFYEKRKTNKTSPIAVCVSNEFYGRAFELVGENFPGFSAMKKSHQVDFIFYLAYCKPEVLVELKAKI
jgi:hypothetical protein